MEYYNINLDKREKVIRSIIQKKIKTAKGFVKFCYILTAILKILGVILGIAHIIYIITVSHEIIDFILLLVTVGFPILMSLLPATVYYVSLGKEYRLRCDEVVAFNKDEFVYSHGISIGSGPDRFVCRVKYSDISEIIRDEKSKLVEIHGKIILESYSGSTVSQDGECKIFDFIDTYEINVADRIKKI